MTKQRNNALKNKVNKTTTTASNSNSIVVEDDISKNKNSSLDDVKNKGEIFQSIDNIFNEFKKLEEENVKKEPHKIWDNYWVKKIIRAIEIIFWISLGVCTAYKTDLINVILYSDQINRFYFNIGLVGLLGFCIIYFYCGYFSNVDVKKNDDDWEKIHPKLIPIATVCLITFTIGIIIGCWSVWGILTPILIFIYFASISYII